MENVFQVKEVSRVLRVKRVVRKKGFTRKTSFMGKTGFMGKMGFMVVKHMSFRESEAPDSKNSLTRFTHKAQGETDKN